MAAIIPYSSPLWTIFVKCPAPLGPAVQIAVLGSAVGAHRTRCRSLHATASGGDHGQEVGVEGHCDDLVAATIMRH